MAQSTARVSVRLVLEIEPRSRAALIALGWTPPPDQDPEGGAADVPQ
jgi:hypothetical protein